MSNPPNTALEMPQRPRGRWKLIAILAVVVMPMILATAMYQWRFWVPTERTYHGQLIGDGSTRDDLGVQAQESRWQLLVTAPEGCDADCQQLVYLARQIHIGLNREAQRASHAIAVTTPLPEDYADKLTREYPQLARYALDEQQYRRQAPQITQPALWIIDPHGNLVLRYDASAQGRSILKDLQLLLKLSRIG